MEKYKILIGQKVYSVTKGELEIVDVKNYGRYPIHTSDKEGYHCLFSIDGKLRSTDIRPELSRYEPKVNENDEIRYIPVNFDEWVEELEGDKKLIEAGLFIADSIDEGVNKIFCVVRKSDNSILTDASKSRLNAIRDGLEHLKRNKRVKGKRYLVCDDLNKEPNIRRFMKTIHKNNHKSIDINHWKYCIPHEFYNFDTGEWLPGHEEWLD